MANYYAAALSISGLARICKSFLDPLGRCPRLHGGPRASRRPGLPTADPGQSGLTHRVGSRKILA